MENIIIKSDLYIDMGKIFDKFNNKTYRNEAAVTNNFVIPLFTEFLGYKVEELLPEERYPARDFYKGVKKYEEASKQLSVKPDFVICIDVNINAPKFLLDTKSPKENIDNHLGQLKSYAHCVGVNIIVITNGTSLKIFDVNDIIFEAETIEELDLKFEELQKILSRDVQISKSTVEIIKNIDFSKSLNKNTKQVVEETKQKRKVKISDFNKYLIYVKDKFTNWQIPEEFSNQLNFKIEKYSPKKLHRFKQFDNTESPVFKDNYTYTFQEIEQKFSNISKLVFIGSSGIGKTTFLKYVAHVKVNIV